MNFVTSFPKMRFDEDLEPQATATSTSSSDSGVVFDDQLKLDNSNNFVRIKNDLNSSKNSINKSASIKKTNCNTPSPALSIRSTNISIVSIEDDFMSSVIDSDSDFETEGNEVSVRKLGEQTICDPKPSDILPDGVGVVVSQMVDGSPCVTEGLIAGRPHIGSIAVQNSADVTFGNKTFYQAPVTIKQFIVNNNNQKDKSSEDGNVNAAFESHNGESFKDYSKENGNFNTKDSVPLGNIPVHSKYFSNKRAVYITAAIVLLSLLVGMIIFSTVALMRNSGLTKSKLGDGDDSRKNIPIDSTIDKDNIGGGKVLRIIHRAEWIAQPPNAELTKLNPPVNRVIIAHTATEGCSNQAMCTFRVRLIQTYHMESVGFDDIGYNFLVGGDGAVYEGRGWDKQGAHTKGYNVDSICIAFIGTFIKEVPPEKQLLAAEKIMEEGVKLGKLSPDYKLYGHRQLIPSESPGTALYEIIKKWSHWTDDL